MTYWKIVKTIENKRIFLYLALSPNQYLRVLTHFAWSHLICYMYNACNNNCLCVWVVMLASSSAHHDSFHLVFLLRPNIAFYKKDSKEQYQISLFANLKYGTVMLSTEDSIYFFIFLMMHSINWSLVCYTSIY